MGMSEKDLHIFAAQRLMTDFEWVKAAIKDKLGFEFRTELDFMNQIASIPKSHFSYACVNHHQDKIYFDLDMLNIYDNRKVVVHELTHLLQFFYKRFLIAPDSIKQHSYDFAMVCAFIGKTIGIQNQHFFNQYDMHEEPTYEILQIRPAKFDALVMQENFTDMESLIARSHEVANGMRKIAWSYDEIQ